jgi:SAM-dependent methyltransferase
MGQGLVFESTKCAFCGSTEIQPLFEGPDRLLGLPGKFRVVRCVDCGLLRQDPRPTRDSISFYYPPNYEPYSIAIDEEPSRLRQWDRRYGMCKRRWAIERYCTGGRLLDVGCATGNFLQEMARSGCWQVEGIEPNAEAARYGKERLGLTIHIGELTTVELPTRFYDVITMWNVFEHLHDPIANLQVIARLLKPGGWFIFSIPNLDSWERRLFGKYWIGWELPRHLYFPSKSLMGAMLHKVGMEIRAWQCLGGAYFSFLFSLRFWLEGVLGRTSLTHAILTLWASWPLRLATAPFFGLVTFLNQASIITGFAQLPA